MEGQREWWRDREYLIIWVWRTKYLPLQWVWFYPKTCYKTILQLLGIRSKFIISHQSNGPKVQIHPGRHIISSLHDIFKVIEEIIRIWKLIKVWDNFQFSLFDGNTEINWDAIDLLYIYFILNRGCKGAQPKYEYTKE